MAKLFIITGSAGEWDSHYEFPVAVTLSDVMANELVEELNRATSTIQAEVRALRRPNYSLKAMQEDVLLFARYQQEVTEYHAKRKEILSKHPVLKYTQLDEPDLDALYMYDEISYLPE